MFVFEAGEFACSIIVILLISCRPLLKTSVPEKLMLCRWKTFRDTNGVYDCKLLIRFLFHEPEF